MHLSLSVGSHHVLSPRATPRSEGEHAKPNLVDIGEWEYLGEYNASFKGSPLISFFGVDPHTGPMLVLVRTTPEQTLNPSGARTDERVRTIAHLSYRVLVRSAAQDFVGYLNFTKEKAAKISSTSIVKALRKQLPFLAHAPSLTEFDFNISGIRTAYEEMDTALLNPTAKLSVVRVKAGQTTEGAILENDEGHGDFREFLTMLGERVALKGWKDFAANLNTTDNSHGTHSVYTRLQDFDVMFHVGPLIAYTSDKQLERKRFIANNVSVIMFLEHGATLATNPFVTQFLQNAVLVQAADASKSAYRLTFLFKDGQKAPPKCATTATLPAADTRLFLLSKMINEERALMQKDKTLHELYAKIRENQLQRFMRALKQADSSGKAPRKREAVLQVPALRELVRVHSDNGITGTDAPMEAVLRPRDWDVLMLGSVSHMLRKGDAPPSTMSAGRNYFRVVSGEMRVDDLSSLGSTVYAAGLDFGERSLFIPQPIAVRCVSHNAEVQQPDPLLLSAALCDLGLALRFLRHFAAKFARAYLLSIPLAKPKLPEEIVWMRKKADDDETEATLKESFGLSEACVRALPCKRSMPELQGTLMLTKQHLCFYSKGSTLKKNIPLPLSEIAGVERDKDKITIISADGKKTYALGSKQQVEELHAAICVLTRSPFPPPFAPTPVLRLFLEKKPPVFTLEPTEWAALGAYSSHSTHKSGTVLIHEGHAVERLSWIHSGQCRVHSALLRSSVPSPRGNEFDQHTIVASLQTGQFFAEAEYLLSCEAVHSVTAATQVEIHALGATEIQSLSVKEPLLLQRLYLYLLYALLEKLRIIESASQQGGKSSKGH